MTKKEKKNLLISSCLESISDRLKSSPDITEFADDTLQCRYCPLNGRCDEFEADTCEDTFRAWLNEEEEDD